MSKIEQQVMASVGAIYLARTLVGATALKLYALLLSVWGIGKLVWVSKVFENLAVAEQSGIQAVGNFILVALSHAQFGVQIALVVAVIAAVSLFLDVTRTSGRRFAA